MARKRRRRFGSSAETHLERAKSTAREVKRLADQLRRQLRDPPDCVHAFHLATTLAEQRGAFLIDRYEGSGRGITGGAGIRALLSKFEKKCVLHPKNRRASQRIHAVWR